MVDNGFNYIIAQTSQGIDFNALGYNGGAVSDDGAWIVIDKGDGTTAADISYENDGPLPSWITAITGGGNDATHAQAKQLVRTSEFTGE